MEPQGKDMSESASPSEPSDAVGDQPQTPAEPAASPVPDTDAESDGPSHHSFPDASSLVAMAAMQMPTGDLIHALIAVFDNHAWRSMGLIADFTGEVQKDMAAAQTAIDCLAFLLGKIESSIDETEKRDIQRRLMDLRMNYVTKLREG